MTNAELYQLFRSTYPEIKPIDYRPTDNVFTEGKVGLTIWNSNGDMLLYFPNPVTLNKLDAFLSREKAKILLNDEGE